MSSDGDEKKWICGGATVNLHRVSSIVREIRDPCLHRTPNRGSKMLRPEKWQSIFDDDGKAVCFRKALKLIILGGVDPSIRPEVWEFLLGCYALSSTAEYRRQLRMARRERYQDLIRECRSMHSSIGTGTLAYAVGSKVLDVRTLSKDNGTREEESRTDLTHTDNCNNKESYSNLGDNGALTYAKYQECSSESVDLLSVRGSTDSAVCDTVVHSSDTYSGFSIKSRGEDVGSHFPSDSYFDFPPLPVTNLFQKISEEEEEVSGCHSSSEQTLGSTDKAMHSFQINNNIDLVMESNDMLSANSFLTSKSNAENFSADVQRHAHGLHNWEENKVVNRLRISDVPQASAIATSTSNMLTANEDRVSEWLWTLHRIVVDVVRTDSHLEFYENSTNMARMSDILAVYAWVDPATGYCQGMSDLLSPFVVLYEDNADAFWCFEMLLRRMRENFQMEGPTGVMKQLQALWKILELTDTEIFTHLSLIGAESLHFAFRMLLVLFRRELSFSEALCMWEMMWAADFDEAAARELDENCLEPLVLQLPRDSNSEMGTDITPNCKEDSQCERHEHCNEETVASHDDEIMPDPSHPFCGLTKASFWARPQHLQVCAFSASVKNSDDELPVFCVAAILITNRQKIIRETHSIDDVIKMFNDNMLKINVKRCIRMAIKLRKKYFYKIAKRTAWEVLNASTI